MIKLINSYTTLIVQTRGLQLVLVKGHFLARYRFLTGNKKREAAVPLFTMSIGKS